MNPIIEIVDNLFDDGLTVRDLIVAGCFENVVSPVDGVTYPAINGALPESITARFHAALSAVIGRPIVANHTFARAMYAGMVAPNQAHSDMSMGRYSAHVYLSQACPLGSGTSFLTHATQGPTHTADTDISLIDSNDPTQWVPVLHVQARFNRLLVHGSEYWHMALPTEGWGDCPSNARLVMTCFFD